MARGFYRNRGLTKDTLLKIATIGIITIAASTSPYFLHRVATAYFQDKIRRAIRARARKLREMQKRKLVAFKELPDGSVRIELAHLGKKLIRHYQLENIHLTKPRRWDRQWRILMYDIPSVQRKASNAFRQKIKELGLFPLQKSVWISPYECLAEIEFVATVFEINIDRYIHYFRVPKIPKEIEVRKFFDI